MKKIKILLIGYGTNLGGIEIFLYNLVKRADKNIFEFSFLTFDNGKNVVFYDELINMNCKIYKITPRKKNYFHFIRDLKKVYMSDNFDIIHFNLMDLSCFERITYAKKYSNAKIIIHSHCGSSELIKQKSVLSQLLHNFGKRKLKNIKHFNVACGEQAGKWMHGRESFTIFYNGIDFEKFKFSIKNREKIRKNLNIKEDEICFGLIASFLLVKNHEFLIDVFKEISKINPKVKLILIGEGNLQEKIKEKVLNLKIQEKVLFLGKKADAYKFYSAMDVYIMPSISEGLSISLCEAQINGLKCYTSKGVDIKSNISGNVTFLSLKRTVEEWAKYILKKENSRDQEVIKKIPDEFNAENSYKKIYDYYISLVK